MYGVLLTSRYSCGHPWMGSGVPAMDGGRMAPVPQMCDLEDAPQRVSPGGRVGGWGLFFLGCDTNAWQMPLKEGGGLFWPSL